MTGVTVFPYSVAERNGVIELVVRRKPRVVHTDCTITHFRTEQELDAHIAKNRLKERT